ncbi:MAG: hypothetical protein U5K54_22495 [Cytophagales bacterium]|nr:hypothetical protein [Cytophagales bacterium]
MTTRLRQPITDSLFITHYRISIMILTEIIQTIPTLRRYQLTYSNLENSALPTATTKASQIGFYVQDEFQVTSNLKLTGGLRVDVPSFRSTEPLENTQVTGYTFKDENGDPNTS